MFFKPGTVLGPVRPGAMAHGVWRPATRGRSTSQLGLGLVARSCRGGGPWRRNGACATTARRWLVGGKVRPGSTRRFPRAHRRKEGVVGSPRRQLDGWGRSGGGAAVFTNGGGAPAIGGGWLELLQHRTQRG
jgi:hypothetical protein